MFTLTFLNFQLPFPILSYVINPLIFKRNIFHQAGGVLNVRELGSEVDTVFLSNAARLSVEDASCVNLRVYYSTVTFLFDGNRQCSPKKVLFQHSTVDRIPGRVLELKLEHSSLGELKSESELKHVYITNSTVTEASMKELTGANVRVVDSEIKSLKSISISDSTFVTFFSSNITIPAGEQLVVQKGGELTLEKANLTINEPQAVTVLPGGKLTVISPLGGLSLLDYKLFEKPKQDGSSVPEGGEQQKCDMDYWDGHKGMMEIFTEPSDSRASSSISPSLVLSILCHFFRWGFF